MRAMQPTNTPLSIPPYRPAISTPEDGADSQSSSNASPTRLDFEESDFFEGNNDSTSSIGVPTFQDMAVSEEDACIPPINRLPPEVLISIFAKLSSTPSDLLAAMLVCRSWAYNSVGLLWHRPNCADLTKHQIICTSLNLEKPYFAYPDFVKRLNLQALADQVNDGSVTPFADCTRIERLTLTNCHGLTDLGLMALLEGSSGLLALDICGNSEISAKSIEMLADNCPKLQGLNISECELIDNKSMIKLAESCRQLKRLKLNGCDQLDDSSINRFALNCPNILEIDLYQCRLITDEPVTNIIQYGRSLRELRLANCEQISDASFLNLPPGRIFDSLRILDLTSCHRLSDAAVEKIIDCAPRLRNLVLAKCRNITDTAVNAISKLGKNLHYLHLGHCNQISDDAVIKLVALCNRIRYIDLGCCIRLTDASVMKLASLPKLKRIGLVKCQLITNASVFALSNTSGRLRHAATGTGHGIYGVDGSQWAGTSSLERVHLSYCTNLTLESIIVLLNSCPRLTHLSLTGVHAFLRDDLNRYCRQAPPEFTPHQRDVFCVFSGKGVLDLRDHLNRERGPPRNSRRVQLINVDDDDEGTVTGEDDDQTMTGLSHQVAGTEIGQQQHHQHNGTAVADDDDDADEELDGQDDDDGNGGAPLQP